MKSVTYPVRFKVDDYKRLTAEAKRRGKPLSELFRDIITYGLPALPPIPNQEDAWERLAAETWEKLGPPPEVDYDKLPKDW